MTASVPLITPNKALQRLTDGNARFVAGKLAQLLAHRDWLAQLKVVIEL
jgi:hypothetical protein